MSGRRWTLGLVTALMLTGCTRGLYLAESEVAAYRAQVQTEAQANAFLQYLDGKQIRLDFVSRGGRARLQRSTILDALRGTSLVLVERLFSQVHLDRLSVQIEQALDAWVGDQVALLQHASGSRVALDPLDRVTLRFLSAPTVSYRADRQVIAFDLHLELRVSGTLKIRSLEGTLRTLLGWVITDQQHAFTATLDDYRLAGEIVLGSDVTGSRVELRVTPQVGTVTVSGIPAGEVADGVRALSRQKFSSTLREQHQLAFDYFALTGLRLSPAGELVATYRDIPERATPSVHVVVQADQAGGLAHGRLHRSVASAFTPVPVPTQVLGPPALVASGPDRVELGFVTRRGEFQHASWAGGRWGQQYTSPQASFAGWRPALVATGPGQLEVILWGRDRGLYHLRRLNGRWLGPARLDDSRVPNRPLFQPSAVRAGNKLVLVFVNNAARVYTMAFDLETAVWSHPVELPGPSASLAPTVASCGDGRVDVVYGGPRPGGAVRHSVVIPVPQNLTSAARAGFSLVTPARYVGNLDADPTLVCSGAYQLELLGRGAGTRLWHTRYQVDRGSWEGRPFQSGWQGWEQLNDQFFGSLFAAGPGYFTAAAATALGDVYAVIRTADGKHLAFNRYLSSRWGRAPRKATHWRGFERFGPTEVFGPPAVAMVDPQVHVVTRGGDGHAWHTSLGDDNHARFAAVPRSFIAFPFDPVVLPGGPGRSEILFPGEDGRVYYVSWRNQSGYRWQALPAPATTTIRSPVAAVGVGSGQLEVVAIGRDLNAYHWRLVNGQWTTPQAVGGPMVSAPALVATGAGQLELLGVGADQRLRRWRFAGGGWRSHGPQAPHRVVGFDPKSVVGAVDGATDVALIEADTNDVYYRRLSPDDPPIPPAGAPVTPWTLVGWDASDIVLAAGPQAPRLVVQRRYDRQVFSRLIGSTGPWATIVDPLARSLLLGGATSLGDGRIALLAADPRDGRLYLARQAGGAGTAFLPLVGQSVDSRFRLPTKPAIAGE